MPTLLARTILTEEQRQENNEIFREFFLSYE